MDKSDRFWFPAKTYGWGWGLPVCWQGWLVYGLYVAAMVLAALYFPPDTKRFAFLISVAVATVILVGVCWVKGERPSWRWGKP